MKRNMLSVAIICFAFAFFSLVTDSHAQKSKKPIKYKATFNPTMKIYDLKIPNYGLDKMEGNRRESKTPWQVLRLEYSLDSNSKKKKQWASNVEFEWHILIMRNKKEGKPLLFSKTVSYLEAPIKEKGLSTSLFIRPQVLKQYFGGKKIKLSDISVKLAVKVNGQKIQVKSAKSGADVFFGPHQKKAVWTYAEPKIAKVVNPQSLFLNKSETPFASVQTGSFQVIKKMESK